MGANENLRLLSPAERRQRNRQEMVDMILTVARALMRENGVAGLSLSELARRLQVTTAALYRYFPGKAALYDALFRIAMQVFWSYITPVWEEYPPGWRQIEAWIEARMRFAQQQPDLFSLLFERPVPSFEPSAESMEDSARRLAEAQRAFARLVEEGIIEPLVPTDRAFDQFNAMTHGLSAQHIANEPHMPIGSGRYGRLVSDTVALFRAAWAPRGEAEAGPSEGGKA